MENTLTEILYGKFLKVVERSTFREMWFFFLKIIIVILITLITTYTDKTMEILLKIFRYNNMIFLKLIFSLIGVFFIPEVYRQAKGYFLTSSELLEGIPVDELLHHLFIEKTFKRDEIENKFGVKRKRYATLANKFEDLGILIRGENNSKILNEEFARQDIVSMLKGKTKAEELVQLFKIKFDRVYDSEPTGGFIRRSISDASISPLEEDEKENE